jgi:carboxyl-terminal processing protease
VVPEPEPEPAAPVFSYYQPGALLAGSGGGFPDQIVHAPGLIFPIKSAPAVLQSQVFTVGGGVAGGDQCDARNYSAPWRDNFCETRSANRTTPFCPVAKIHQGQDIRVGTAADCNALRRQSAAERGLHEVIAVEDGVITSIGTYTVKLRSEGSIYKYMHLNMKRLAVTAGQNVKAGDLIIRLDDKPVKGLSLNDAVKIMRGEPGSAIVLTIVREGAEQPIKLKLIRDIIKVKSVRSRLLEPGYGYVRLSSFQAKTGESMIEAIEEMKKSGKLKGLVLDLRNNPGGVLNAAVTVSDAFLDEGLVVYTDGRIEDSKMKFNATTGDLLEGAPIVVLINAGSASASEIVAGALQDHNRAVIMGEKTFGKGSVQTILPTSNGAAVKLTTARYYTPSGRSIQAEGISPDVLISKVKLEAANQSEFGPIKEADLANHLENNNPSPKREPIKELTAPKETPKGAADSEDALALQDYPLNEALNLLRGINIVKKTPKATSAKP